jgi:protein-tyrosine-phosphatase/DNA-binding transcriptional ArsR family regulator
MHAALGEPVRLVIVDQLVLGDASPGELGDLVGLPTNLLAHHLKVLDEAGLIRRVRSEGDRRRSYVQLALDDPVVAALVRAHAPTPPPAERVVFVCSHNSARSQLAAAAWATTSGVPVASAGTHPATRVHPRAIRVGRRHGLNLRGAGTAHVDDVVRTGDLVVAVCDNAHEELPDVPKLHWSVPDPSPSDTDDAFEAAYEAITERVERLAHALTPTTSTPRRSPAR